MSVTRLTAPAWMGPEDRYYQQQRQQQEAQNERDRAFSLLMQLYGTGRDIGNQTYYDKLRAMSAQQELLRAQQSQRQYLNSLDLDAAQTGYQRAVTQVPSSLTQAMRSLGY